MERIISLYSTPRSGSTYIEVALRKYFLKHGGYKSLSEYFNLNLKAQLINESLQVDPMDWHPQGHKDQLTPEEFLNQKNERLDWLFQSEGKYLLKVLGFHLRTDMLLKFLPRTSLILSYRENSWEQLLSHMISSHLGNFYEMGGLNWDENSLQARRTFFDDFMHQRKRYLLVKNFLFPQAEICFEKFVSGKGDYMQELGFDLPFEWEQVDFPLKQNKQDKEKAFSNINELRSWYEEAALDTEQMKNG